MESICGSDKVFNLMLDEWSLAVCTRFSWYGAFSGFTSCITKNGASHIFWPIKTTWKKRGRLASWCFNGLCSEKVGLDFDQHETKLKPRLEQSLAWNDVKWVICYVHCTQVPVSKTTAYTHYNKSIKAIEINSIQFYGYNTFYNL